MRKYISAAIFVILFIFCITLQAGSGELNQEDLDSLLKSRWNEMKAALADEDIEKALTYFYEEQRAHYRKLFTAFSDRLPQVITKWQDIELVKFEDRTAIYRLRKDEVWNGKTHTVPYEVIFVLDRDDIWRIYHY